MYRFHQFNGARRRRYQLFRFVPDSEAKLEHVPRFPGILPLCQLVAPRRVMLRPSQLIRLGRVVQKRLCPIRPRQPSFRRLILWPLLP